MSDSLDDDGEIFYSGDPISDVVEDPSEGGEKPSLSSSTDPMAGFKIDIGGGGDRTGYVDGNPDQKSQESDVGETSSPITTDQCFNVKCDDCEIPEPARIWRWCKDCSRVLCETCVVNDHRNHVIESYASAVRRSDEEMRQALDLNRSALEDLRHGNETIVEWKSKICEELNDVKEKIRAKTVVGKDIDATLKEHLSAMKLMEREPLNAKTWLEREDMYTDAEKLIDIAQKNLIETRGFLKNANESVDDAEKKMNEKFREDSQ